VPLFCDLQKDMFDIFRMSLLVCSDIKTSCSKPLPGGGLSHCFFMDLLLWRADENLVFAGARGAAKDEGDSSE
jgi:hypothetical protein